MTVKESWGMVTFVGMVQVKPAGAVEEEEEERKRERERETSVGSRGRSCAP